MTRRTGAVVAWSSFAPGAVPARGRFFSSRLRDEIDLNSLNAELVEVVSRTMQPSHVSVWVTARGADPR